MATKAMDWKGLRHRLTEEMRVREWGQRQLAEALHVQQPSVSKFLKGGGASPELLWHAARLLGAQMEALVPDELKKEARSGGTIAIRPTGLQREASRRLLQLANDILVAVDREATDLAGEDRQIERDQAQLTRRGRDGR